MSGANFRPANIYYVSKDAVSSPTGGPLSPYPSLTAALAVVNALPVGAGSQTIVLYPGTYVENPTITRGYVNITSFAPSGFSNAVTTINGTVTINITANGNVSANQVQFSHLTIAQPLAASESVATITDVSTVAHSLLLHQCSFAGKNRILSHAHSASDSRLYVEDCEFYQIPAVLAATPLSVILHSGTGGAIIERCNVTASQDATLLEVAGNATLWQCSLCNFQSATLAAAPKPIVAFRSSLVYPTAVSLCAFAYTQFGPSARPASSCGIAFGGGVGQTLILSQCYFLLLGTTNAGDAVHVEDSASHTVYSTGCFAFPGTAYIVNTAFSKLLPLSPT